MANATELAPDTKASKFRDEFLRWEQLVWKLSEQEFEELKVKFADYPLLPYLEERKLLHRLSLKKEKAISQFLIEYKGTVLEDRVRVPWLRYLAKRNDITRFLKYYRPVSDTQLRCHYVSFQLAAKQKTPSWNEQVKALWNVGKSQDKACDAAFQNWIANGELNEDLVLQRIQRAAKGGQHTLIPYLKTLLRPEQQYLADVWHSVRRDPANIRHLSRFTGEFALIESEILSYGLRRLVWRDRDLALSVFARAQQKMTITLVKSPTILPLV